MKRIFEIKENKYLIIHEDNKIIKMDLEKMFPYPYIEYDLGPSKDKFINTYVPVKPTPLEAWEEVKRQIGCIRFCRFDLNGGTPQITPMLVRDTGLYEIIETALERLIKLEDVFSEIKSGEAVVVSAEKTVALEIIKEKGCLQFCMLGVGLEDYNHSVDIENKQYGFERYKHYNQEEFELLKEVLL